MKITFEGNLVEILDQMEGLRAAVSQNIFTGLSEKATTTAIPKPATFQGPGPDTAAFNPPAVEHPVDTPVEHPVEKPKRPRTAKQLENDERLRVAAIAKLEAKKAAKQQAAPAPAPVEKPKAAAPADPAEVVKIRQKTIEDLQTAYANGHQQEVFELLSRFGNGAKSFRELPPEAFMPIREAIDKGALT